MNEESRVHEATQCPRCGYDLRGLTGLWTDSCPLEGTCSECGLAFEWARVCCPDKYVPEWCIEYGRGSRAWGGTIRRLLLPWVFWGRLRIEHPPRLKRVVRFVVLLFLILAFGSYVLLQGSAAIMQHQRIKQQVGAYPAQVQRLIPTLQAMIALLDQIKASEDPVRAFDVYFGGGPDLTVEEVNQLIANERQQCVAQLQQITSTSSPDFAMPMWLAIVEGIFLPGGDTSFGLAMGPPLNMPYPAPSELGWMHADSGLGPVLEPTAWTLGFLLSVALIFPVTMLLLVQSRRRTRLHMRHLARITLYQVVLLVLIGFGLSLVHEVSFLLEESIDTPGSVSTPLLWVGGVLYFVWWFCALRQYARMPHAFFVVLIHLVMSALFIGGGAFFLGQLVL